MKPIDFRNTPPWPALVLVGGLIASVTLLLFGVQLAVREQRAFEAEERHRLTSILGVLDARLSGSAQMLDRELAVLEVVVAERLLGPGRSALPNPVMTPEAMQVAAGRHFRDVIASAPHLLSLALLDEQQRIVASSHPYNEGLVVDTYQMGLVPSLESGLQVGVSQPYLDFHLREPPSLTSPGPAVPWSVPVARGFSSTLSDGHRLIALVDPAYLLTPDRRLLETAAVSAYLLDLGGRKLAQVGLPMEPGQDYTLGPTLSESGHFKFALAQQKDAAVARRDGLVGSFHWAPPLAAALLLVCTLLLARSLARWRLEQQSIAASQRAAQEAHAAKTAFLTHMAHDLRTSVGTILGMARALEDAALSPEQRRHLEAIAHAADTLLQSANRVITLARFEAGLLELDHEPFDLQCLCREVASAQASGESPSPPVELSLGDDLPRRVVGDAPRLRQALQALLEFARAAGAPAAQVRLEGSLLGMVAGRYLVALDIRWHNPGPCKVPQAVDTALTLAVARAVAESMAGQLEDIGRPDGGRCALRFTGTLAPAQADADTLPASVAGPPAAPLGPGLVVRVLVAEDIPTNQQILLKLLQRLGCEVDIAADGQACLERRMAHDYDLVLMDLQMPVMDGLQATRAIRSWEATRQCPPVPVVAVTAHGDTADKQACLAAGMSGFINKPLRPAELQALLVRHTRWVQPAAA